MSTPASELAYLSRALKAPRIRSVSGRLAARAREEGWDYEAYLAAVLAEEVSARDGHGGQARVKAARFPAVKTLDDFDFTIQHGGTIELTTPFVVAQAVLAHLEDWATLDASGRQTAIEKVHLEILTRHVDAFVAAANAHGLPLCAPELHPPLTWPVGRTGRFLDLFAADGQIIDTGERRNFYPVYDLPSHGPPLAQPVSDAQETGTATATTAGGAGQLEDAARNGDLNVIDEYSADAPTAAAAGGPTGPSR